METIVEQLRRGLARRRWWMIGVSAFVTVSAVATASWALKPTPTDPCAHAGAPMRALWPANVRDALTDATRAAPAAPRSRPRSSPDNNRSPRHRLDRSGRSTLRSSAERPPLRSTHGRSSSAPAGLPRPHQERPSGAPRRSHGGSDASASAAALGRCGGARGDPNLRRSPRDRSLAHEHPARRRRPRPAHQDRRPLSAPLATPKPSKPHGRSPCVLTSSLIAASKPCTASVTSSASSTAICPPPAPSTSHATSPGSAARTPSHARPRYTRPSSPPSSPSIHGAAGASSTSPRAVCSERARTRRSYTRISSRPAACTPSPPATS
jgi:hypothetical protein